MTRNGREISDIQRLYSLVNKIFNEKKLANAICFVLTPPRNKYYHWLTCYESLLVSLASYGIEKIICPSLAKKFKCEPTKTLSQQNTNASKIHVCFFFTKESHSLETESFCPYFQQWGIWIKQSYCFFPVVKPKTLTVLFACFLKQYPYTCANYGWRPLFNLETAQIGARVSIQIETYCLFCMKWKPFIENHLTHPACDRIIVFWHLMSPWCKMVSKLILRLH